MMRPAISLLLIGLVAGCTSTPPPAKQATSTAVAPATLSDAERAIVERDTLAALPDVSNASFRTISASKSSNGTMTVCGYINVVASSGTSSGDKPFIGVLSGSEFLLSAMGGSKEETIAVQAECIQSRVYI